MARSLCILSAMLIATCALIAQVGKVGINTTTPQAMLHVVDSSVVFSAADNIPAMPGNPPLSGAGRRMMWYPDKAAFRVGYVDNGNWNIDSTGDYSIAMGYGTKAKGIASTAIGFSCDASGYISTAMGRNAIASGEHCTALGAFSLARSGYETAVGIWNTDYTPASTSSAIPTDRLFVIGNGTGNGSRSDALIILKNGNTGIGVSSPQRKLHVSNGNSGASFHSGAVIGVEDDNNAYVNIVTPSANESGVLFGNPANAAFGGIIYNNEHITDSNSLYFRVNSATRMAIYQNGTAWIQSTLNIGNDGQLKIYDASGTRYVQLFHSSSGNLHLDAIGGGTNYISWYGGSGLHVGNGSGAGYGPVEASAFNITSARRF
ncbi:MAG TPA: hypothetical protein VI603_00430, partial [Saprospiraceae bacterium]|nr:hypothetical protein [Saprospiraceae bacterium]